MPKAILEFNLPEEQDEFETVCSADNMKQMLDKFSQELRTWERHGHNFKDADEAVEKIRERFYEITANYNCIVD